MFEGARHTNTAAADTDRRSKPLRYYFIYLLHGKQEQNAQKEKHLKTEHVKRGASNHFVGAQSVN